MSNRRWKKDSLDPTIDKFPLRKQSFERSGGETVGDIYGPDTPPEKVGFPGEYPYTRGIRATGYRGRLWTMRQYAGFGTAKESNERYRYLLSQGTSGLSVAFDLPTQMGFDSDHDNALGEVGKVGVAIDSIADMRVLFDQIPLDKVRHAAQLAPTVPAIATRTTSPCLSFRLSAPLVFRLAPRLTCVFPAGLLLDSLHSSDNSSRQ